MLLRAGRETRGGGERGSGMLLSGKGDERGGREREEGEGA